MSHLDEDHIEFTRVRPRIRVHSDYSPDEIIQRISSFLEQEECNCDGKYMKDFATIMIPEEEQHLWSPQLTLTIEKMEIGSLVRGLYGPKPSLWTLFFFFYVAIGFAALIIAMIGLSFWSLDKPTTILWLVPALGLVFLSLYLVAYSGQKLGHKQMYRLHRFIEKVVDHRIDTI